MNSQSHDFNTQDNSLFEEEPQLKVENTKQLVGNIQEDEIYNLKQVLYVYRCFSWA